MGRREGGLRPPLPSRRELAARAAIIAVVRIGGLTGEQHVQAWRMVDAACRFRGWTPNAARREFENRASAQAYDPAGAYAWQHALGLALDALETAAESPDER